MISASQKSATKNLTIAIAGLGTVGQGVIKIIQEHASLLSARTGANIIIKAVSARNKSRDRGLCLDNIAWHEDALKLASLAEVDVVVEVIGGADGVAYQLCKTALENGKHVVTANKALLAKHGLELANIAEQNNVTLAFEAAIAGGIPIVKGLKEGLAANKIVRLAGILNGTCNYVLTAMRDTKRGYDEILKEAQELGYAEADPSFDVDGIDAAHKLVLLTSLAFGVPINPEIKTEGIRNITLADIDYARELGYAIKLLGLCENTPDGIRQAVYPALVPLENPIAGVDGVHNAVLVQGDYVGNVMFEGPGAGEGATASAVVADIADIAAGRKSFAFGIPTSAQNKASFLPLESRVGEYYLRIEVADESGVLAGISKELNRNGISLEAVIQKPPRMAKTATIVATTHEVSEKTLQKAVAKISEMQQVVKAPVIIRVESL